MPGPDSVQGPRTLIAHSRCFIYAGALPLLGPHVHIAGADDGMMARELS